MTHPYKTPTTNPSLPHAPPPKLRLAAIIGLTLYAAPIYGLAITLFLMSRAFNSLSQPGNADPSILAKQISNALYASLLSLILTIIGTGILRNILLKNKNREPWLYWTTITLSILISIAAFPLALIPATYTIITFLKRKSEFTHP